VFVGVSSRLRSSQDSNLQPHSLQECASKAFHCADIYAGTLSDFHEFYRQNELLDLEKIKDEDHDVTYAFMFLNIYLLNYSMLHHLLCLGHVAPAPDVRVAPKHSLQLIKPRPAM